MADPFRILVTGGRTYSDRDAARQAKGDAE